VALVKRALRKSLTGRVQGADRRECGGNRAFSGLPSGKIGSLAPKAVLSIQDLGKPRRVFMK